MVVAMVRVEVEVLNYSSNSNSSVCTWSSPQFVPVVCFLEHRSRFKVDRLLNFGDVALGSTKTASATLRIKVSGDSNNGEDSTVSGSSFEDFHYVAMLVPPTAAARSVGSLVIANGQNGNYHGNDT